MQAPGEELLGKFWTTLADKGIGSLLKPWQMRREGMASAEIEAHRMVLLAVAQKKAEEIAARPTASMPLLLENNVPGQRPVLRHEPTLDLADIDARFQAQNFADSLRREISLQKALGHAEKELSNDPSPAPEKSVGDDWIYRWRDYASDASAEQLQQLWGRVLAGEFKRPNAFSLRTLEFLRSLDVSEADLIQEFAKYVYSDSIIDCILPEEYRNNITKLLILQSMGVVSGVGSSLVKTYTISRVEGDEYYTHIGRYPFFMRIYGRIRDQKLELRSYVLTKLGGELMKLSGVSITEDSVRRIGLHIKEMGFRVELVKAGVNLGHGASPTSGFPEPL